MFLAATVGKNTTMRALIASATLSAFSAFGAITENQVLLVINTNSADSVAIGTAYTNLHPAVHTVRIGTTTANIIPRADFFTQIRDPIRNYLNSQASLATQIVAIVTTKGIPHQLHGDNSEGLFSGTASYAAVDSDLVLLWQDMAAGPTFSNIYPANCTVLNPYYRTNVPLSSFSRSNIKTAKAWSSLVVSNNTIVFESPAYGFNGNNAFGFSTKSGAPASQRLTPGDLYLVTRLSGYSVADVTNALARTQNIEIYKFSDTVLLDKASQNFDGTIYSSANTILTNAGFSVVFDQAGTLATNLPPGKRLLSYSTYGTYQSPSAGAYYIYSNTFSYATGAIFNSYESFNGVEFSSPTNGRSQAQVADWFSVGGSLGFGHVNEPFTFAVANENWYLPNLLVNGLTWAEAAYSSLFVISWENIILGDPLARITVLPTNAPAQFAVSPASLEFDEAHVGGGKTLAFVVRNDGDGILNGEAAMQDGGTFSVVAGSPFALTAGQTANVVVEFAPVSTATTASAVIFTSNAGGATNAVTGTGAYLFPPGDVNGDAKVTGADSLLINQVQVGLRSSTSSVFAAAGYANGDVNQNGAVSGGDSLLINQTLVGLRSYLVTKPIPNSRPTTESLPITIYGIAFPTNGSVSASIGSPVDLVLSNVVVVNREQITAIVPAGGGSGTGLVSVVATSTNGVVSFGRFVNP
jgi:hypothetical protein